MNNKLLGIIAMGGAPFLFIDFIIHGQNGGGEQFEHTSLSGILSIIYISAWMCSMIGLMNIQAAGNSKVGRIWMIIPLITLSLANIWNVWETLQPGANTMLYHMLDAFWPLSNSFMFLYGLRVLWARELQGWKRFVPLLVGLWLPISILLSLSFGLTPVSMIISGIYSAICWTVLGYVVHTSQPTNKQVFSSVLIRP